MVMEEEPSPESVGREFVRQYYTVLNACPENLHRFYSTDSSFVHGGLDQPGETTRCAKGQAEIHKKIMSLKLKECRAKIRQVDSFETVNGALVIQVIGELANSGESMRRFVQTFVLVQQSPKSYYVNNDIFRYQDDAFRDEESEHSGKTGKQTGDDAMDSSVAPSADHHVPSNNVEAYTNGAWSENEVKKEDIHAAPNAPFAHQAANSGVRGQTDGVPQSMAYDGQRQRVERASNAGRPTSPVTDSNKDMPVDTQITASPQKESGRNAERASDNRSPAAPVSSKPLTFAAVAGGGRTSPGIVNQKSTSNQHKMAHGPKANATEKPNQEITASPNDEQEVAQEQSHGQTSNTGSYNARGNFRGSYPNEQQVFVGNLPQDVSDEELQDFMNKFGGVVEVKICNKQQPGRQAPGRITPAFAFVTFENVDAVDKMLGTLPINDFRGHMRLNIERKQERERANFYGGGAGGNFRGGQQSGGQNVGGRGGMRGTAGRRFGGPPRGGGSSTFDNRQ